MSTKQVLAMDWSDAVLLLLVVAILVLYIRLMLKNKRLRQMAEEANRLRLEATEAERRNRQLKQEMTSNIAHELKTPLSSIRGYLEILLGEHPVDEERRRHYLDRCYRQTLRLSDLIKDVSLINKLEESADLFPTEEVDVREIAQDAVDELSDKAAAANITVENRLPEEVPFFGNRELLYGIFRNLIENAVAYAGDGCRVVIETYNPKAVGGQLAMLSGLNARMQTEGKRAVNTSLTADGRQTDTYNIHFYDTGTGVADEYLSRLFDRFLRIDQGRSRRNGGTGLGLSIVKHAVQFHGGEIYVRNRRSGVDGADGGTGLEYYFAIKSRR